MAWLAACLLGASAALATPRVVAVGDLHGDHAAWLDIAQAAGIIDSNGRWTGGDTVLVQLGDVPDRGADTLKIIQSLQALEKEAAKAGGKVIALVGNHEAMNIAGDLRYVSAGEYAAFEGPRSEKLRNDLFKANKMSILAFYRRTDPEIGEATAKIKWFAEYPLGKVEHRMAWAPKGEIGRWIASHPAIVRIGRTLFVHGGISAETAVQPIDAINAEVSARLAKGESDEPSILNNELGPLWYRGNVQREAPPPSAEGAPPAPQRPSIADELTQVLAAYDADRLVVAHTPDLAGIEASQNGRLIRVDTGISAAYGGPHSWLEISDGRTIAHRKDADGQWSSRVLPVPVGVGQ